MPRKFLVVVDDSPEFNAALGYATRRARSTQGRVVLLRAIPDTSDEHWSGVRDEIRRQQRDEAERLLARIGDEAAEKSGAPAIFLIEEGEAIDAIRNTVKADPDIKVLVLAASSSNRGPGPLVSTILKQGNIISGRKLPVTIVPGELSEEDLDDLA